MARRELTRRRKGVYSRRQAKGRPACLGWFLSCRQLGKAIALPGGWECASSRSAGGPERTERRGAGADGWSPSNG